MTAIVTARLTELATEINRAQGLMRARAMDMLTYANQIGNWLLEVKLELRHGEFEGWVADNVEEIGLVQSQKYMRLARNWKLIEPNLSSRQISGIDDALKIAAKNKQFQDNLKQSNPAAEDEPPPDMPIAPTKAERFANQKSVAKQYGEQFMRAVDDLNRIGVQADHKEAIEEITNALRRLNRWK
jgi:hypothetical protein